MGIPLLPLPTLPTGSGLTEKRVNRLALFVGWVGLQEMDIHWDFGRGIRTGESV
jgi:hypothetical protein